MKAYQKGLNADRKGKTEKAIRFYTEAIDASPAFDEAHRRRADDLMLVKRWEEALADLHRLVKSQPGENKWRLMRGRVYVEAGKPDCAFEDLDSLLNRNPHSVPALHLLSDVLMATGRTAQALTPLNQLLQITPDDASALLKRGILRTEFRDFDGAMNDFNRSCQVTPRDPLIYVYRGSLFLRLNDERSACQDLQTALSMNFVPDTKTRDIWVELQDRCM